jgi:hypothetical protein
MGNLNLVSMLSVLAILAFLVEAIVEIMLASWLWKGKEEKAEARVTVLQLSASAVGVVLAIVFNLNVVGMVLAAFEMEPAYPAFAAIVGCVLTGLLFGRGANWFHDFGKRWLELDGAGDWPD